jgi:hypothetical protein
VEKEAQKLAIGTSVIFQNKMSEVNNCPMDEKSPNLVTLVHRFPDFGFEPWRQFELQKWTGASRRLRDLGSTASILITYSKNVFLYFCDFRMLPTITMECEYLPSFIN